MLSAFSEKSYTSTSSGDLVASFISEIEGLAQKFSPHAQGVRRDRNFKPTCFASKWFQSILTDDQIMLEDNLHKKIKEAIDADPFCDCNTS